MEPSEGVYAAKELEIIGALRGVVGTLG